MPLDFFEEFEALEKRNALLEKELQNAINIVCEVSNQIGDPYGTRENNHAEDYVIMEREANKLAKLAYRLVEILVLKGEK
jgi:hypothetical protein